MKTLTTFSFLLFLFYFTGCNILISDNSPEKKYEQHLTLDPVIIDSISALECDCYRRALLIQDSYSMKIYGMNCYKYLIDYLTSKNYQDIEPEVVRAFHKDMYDLVGEKTYNNCPSFGFFYATLNEKRETDNYLVENPELIKYAKKGKFKSLEVDDNIIVTICDDYVRTDYKDFGYYSLSTIEWIDEFSYFEIFQETDHPFFLWRPKNDTLLVNTISVSDSIIEYDIITRRVIYPGVMKRIN